MKIFFRPGDPRGPLALYLLTILTTWMVGGFLYSFGIMFILTFHELGHYVMCRRYGVSSTYPLFIPVPFHLFGTMGAIIKMGGRIPNRNALFDIGAAGPLAGLIVAFPITVMGLLKSKIVPLPTDEPLLVFGDSILFRAMEYILIGKIPQGYDVMLHPLAYAGWVGMFVTALNLFPVGQLDGGHVLYALFGQRVAGRGAIVFLGIMALLSFFHPAWAFLVVLLLVFKVWKHPPTIEDSISLTRGRYILGWIVLALLPLLFVPVPVEITGG